MNLAAARKAQRKGAGAAKEVRHCPRAGERVLGECGESRFARLCRLQKAAGRQRDEGLAECDARRAALHDDRAVIGEAREIEGVCGPGQLAGLGEFERSRSPEIDVKPFECRGHADVERLAEAAKIAAERTRRFDRAAKRGSK